jgi:hypothetical protein
VNMPRITYAAAITVAATLVPLIIIVNRAFSRDRQKRKGNTRGLIPVPGFADAKQQERGVGVEYVFLFLLSSFS